MGGEQLGLREALKGWDRVSRMTKERGGGRASGRGNRAEYALPQPEEAHSGKCKWYFLVAEGSVQKKG